MLTYWLTSLAGPKLCSLPPRQAPDSRMASQRLRCPDHLWSVRNVPSPPQAPGTSFCSRAGITRHAWPTARSPFWPAATTCDVPQRHLFPYFLAVAYAGFSNFKQSTSVWSPTWGEAAGTRLESWRSIQSGWQTLLFGHGHATSCPSTPLSGGSMACDKSFGSYSLIGKRCDL